MYAWLLWIVVARVAPASSAPHKNGHRGLIGARAVLEPIGDHRAGSVQIRGEVWTAGAYEDELIAQGSNVDVIEIRVATEGVAVLRPFVDRLKPLIDLRVQVCRSLHRP